MVSADQDLPFEEELHIGSESDIPYKFADVQ